MLIKDEKIEVCGWHHNALERWKMTCNPVISARTSFLPHPESRVFVPWILRSRPGEQAKHRALFSLDATDFTMHFLHSLFRCPCVMNFQAPASSTVTGQKGINIDNLIVQNWIANLLGNAHILAHWMPCSHLQSRLGIASSLALWMRWQWLSGLLDPFAKDFVNFREHVISPFPDGWLRCA